MTWLTKTFLIFLGAGLGGNARFWLGSWVQWRSDSGFPIGTMVINVTGSIVIGAIMAYLTLTKAPDEWRLFLVVGFLGGYTTFSSFSYDSIGLLNKGALGQAMMYIGASVILSLIGTWVGIIAIQLLFKK